MADSGVRYAVYYHADGAAVGEIRVFGPFSTRVAADRFVARAHPSWDDEGLFDVVPFSERSITRSEMSV